MKFKFKSSKVERDRINCNKLLDCADTCENWAAEDWDSYGGNLNSIFCENQFKFLECLEYIDSTLSPPSTITSPADYPVDSCHSWINITLYIIIFISGGGSVYLLYENYQIKVFFKLRKT